MSRRTPSAPDSVTRTEHVVCRQFTMTIPFFAPTLWTTSSTWGLISTAWRRISLATMKLFRWMSRLPRSVSVALTNQRLLSPREKPTPEQISIGWCRWAWEDRRRRPWPRRDAGLDTSMGGHDNDGEGGPIASNCLEEFQPGHSGHDHIRDHHRRPNHGDLIEGRLSVASDLDFISPSLQKRAKSFERIWVVIGQKNSLAGTPTQRVFVHGSSERLHDLPYQRIAAS